MHHRLFFLIALASIMTGSVRADDKPSATTAAAPIQPTRQPAEKYWGAIVATTQPPVCGPKSPTGGRSPISGSWDCSATRAAPSGSSARSPPTTATPGPSGRKRISPTPIQNSSASAPRAATTCWSPTRTPPSACASRGDLTDQTYSHPPARPGVLRHMPVC